MNQLPDRPKNPGWLQKIQWFSDPLAYLDSAAQKYGDIFQTSALGTAVVSNKSPVLLVSNPQALKQIFTNDPKQFTAPKNRLARPIVGDYSVSTLEGLEHQRERKLLMPAFHGERMRNYGRLIADITVKRISQLKPDNIFIAHTVMQDISLEVILNAVFGIYEGERFRLLKKLLHKFTDSLESPLILSVLYLSSLRIDLGSWSPWGYFLRLKQQINELIYAEIKERRENYDYSRTDILTLMMSACDENGQSMTDVELHDELITLLLGGYETTATAITWALYWVNYLPEVKEKLLQELDSLDDRPDAMSIAKLPYLTAVCNETLRIYPTVKVTFPRVVQKPVELMGYHLESGTTVLGCIYLTHQREDLYPNPKQFNPERFLLRQFSPYEFLPFGGGSRRCIGYAFAPFQIKLVLATILSRYELTLASNEPEKPKPRGIGIIPASGVKMRLKGNRLRQEKATETVIK